ncbi:hypothetical protein EV424DRAFT_1545264 [Suillus variegatus]|nr:hypothetical protein EV424DRAFT_1545264 [Suillus variegatus]
MPETRTYDHVQEGRLPRPIHRLQYLDLAFFNDDTSLLCDYLAIHFHATFDFEHSPESPQRIHICRGKGGKPQNFLAIWSPDIKLLATSSHPPIPALADAIAGISRILQNRVLPEIHEELFNGCWAYVKIPPHLQLKTSESTLSAVTHAMTSITPPNDTQTSALSAPTSLVPISPHETVTTGASTMPLASGAVSFETVKAGLAIHHLPRGVLREIHSCINQDAGFEVPQWQYVLEENLVFEPLMSTMLKLMHAISAGITKKIYFRFLPWSPPQVFKLEAFEPPSLPIFEIASVPPRIFKLEAFEPPSLPIFETMARTGKTRVVERVHPQLTTSQKATRREKFVSLTNDINDTQASYMDEVQGLAKKHGRCRNYNTARRK